MSFVPNFKIRTKILCLLIPTCAVGIGGVLYVSNSYRSADQEYSEFIGGDGHAEINMAIASQRLVAVTYDAYQVYPHQSGSPELARAAEDYKASKDRLLQFMASARQALPDRAEKILSFEQGAKAVVSITDEALAAGSRDDDETAKAALIKADDLNAKLLPEIRDWINGMSTMIDTKSDALTDKTNATISSALMGVTHTVAAGPYKDEILRSGQAAGEQLVTLLKGATPNP
ncbi:hypothetical protein RMR16_023645 (plasmid) [Agrobacterium sp. rho-13.3]|uniref:hypothetical protein n=1 Tax=Agrobacterium sp. rho-13.3 TaxID=3072980 RepID=UPI002A16E3DD|nr:hypothetical protein [Agrobacterium sp. rho-13.3]MDX8311871.1 hypothetical protein [Agrobacterium sp. rho-13.3]